MRYTFIDGFSFDAQTPAEVCEALRNSMKFNTCPDFETWARRNARVMLNAFGARLRTDNPGVHVADMLRAGILRAA